MSKSFTAISLILLISFIFIFTSFDFAMAKCKCECQNGTQSIEKNQSDCNQKCSSASGICTTIDSTKLNNPVGASNINIIDLIGRIIQAFLGIIGTISLVMFVYAGFLILTASGKAGQIQKGQQTMVWASLGILIVFASYAILKFVFTVFGI